MTTEIDETSPDVEAESIGLIGAGLVYQALSARLVDMGYRVSPATWIHRKLVEWKPLRIRCL